LAGNKTQKTIKAKMQNNLGKIEKRPEKIRIMQKIV
jgi:hypothetical protein